MYKKLEKLLKQKGISAFKLAKECGFDQSTISKWKTKGMNPTINLLKKICKYLDVSVEYFL